MNAAASRPTGLPLPSSRPPSRAARREEAARLRAEQEAAAAAAAEQDDAAAEQEAAAPSAPTAPAPELPTAAAVATGPAIAIPMKKRGDKRPFSTQLRAETVTRLAWLVEQGGVLTDTVDAAITTYLDAAGVPRPGPDGTMPRVS